VDEVDVQMNSYASMHSDLSTHHSPHQILCFRF